jgi:hypothetical protein
MGAVPLFYTCKIYRYSRLVPGYPCIISWWKVSHISRAKFLFRAINHFNSQASRTNILCMPDLIAFSFSNEFHAFFLPHRAVLVLPPSYYKLQWPSIHCGGPLSVRLCKQQRNMRVVAFFWSAKGFAVINQWQPDNHLRIIGC